VHPLPASPDEPPRLRYWSWGLPAFTLVWLAIYLWVTTSAGEGGLDLAGQIAARRWPLILVGLAGATLGNATAVGGGLVFIPALILGRNAVIAGVETTGSLPSPQIPAPLHILSSSDLAEWTEMEVDYRAVGRIVTLAGPDAAHQWLATDTGMILHLEP
jgi:hypothetical protein